MKFLAFDIETAKVIPSFADWKQYRPLGISCAATFVDGECPQGWYSIVNRQPAPSMSVADLRDLVGYLQYMVDDGYTILTWNGLAFDFDVLAEESGMPAACAKLALEHHVDMMFHLFCLRGHYLALNKVAQEMKVTGKLSGMSGAEAPRLWSAGQCEKVLDYVKQDVRTTLNVAHEIERLGMIAWRSSSGQSHYIDIDRLLTVKEALQLPLPDTSWMTNPPSRQNFVAWIDNAASK